MCQSLRLQTTLELVRPKLTQTRKQGCFGQQPNINQYLLINVLYSTLSGGGGKMSDGG
jgi:hypothetical protein